MHNDIEQRPTECIRFAIAVTSLATVLVATSDRGIVAVLLGGDRDALTRELARDFPAARCTRDDEATEDALTAVVALIESPRGSLARPLDPRGTTLERAVWTALREIPVGTTVSYGQLAKRLPLPATALEVGAACAANRIAVAIPCHRVVKADGGISGYRWGVHRKRALLSRERA